MSMWQCRLIEQWWDGGTVWCPCGNVDLLNSGGMEELSGVHVAM